MTTPKTATKEPVTKESVTKEPVTKEPVMKEPVTKDNGIKDLATKNNGTEAVDSAVPAAAPEPASSTLDAASLPELTVTQTAEDSITQAIQVLSNLATLKLKTQESKDQSLEVLRKIESLFKLEEPISPQDLEELKSGFKTLNKFALAVNQYHETKTKAEAAKKVLDTILGSFKVSTN